LIYGPVEIIRKDIIPSIKIPTLRALYPSQEFASSNLIFVGKTFRRHGSFSLIEICDIEYTRKGVKAVPNNSPVINLNSFVLIRRPIPWVAASIIIGVVMKEVSQTLGGPNASFLRISNKR
jgi:hypothetical protein